MAKMFYTSEEAAERLGKTEDDLRGLVRDGALREFRDAGTTNYRVDDVEALAKKLGNEKSSESGGSATGDIILEPTEDSGISISPSGSDVLSLEEVDPSGGTSAGTRAGTSTGTGTGTGTGKSDSKAAKEGSVVPSVGVNVFDDDDLDEAVDPLAQTAVTDIAGLGMESPGGGSGIMNLSRESDDTSLGSELLDEIYTSDDDAGGGVEMGEATRAGLDEALPEGGEEAETADDVFTPETEKSGTAGAPSRASAGMTHVIEYAPDAMSAGLTAAMVVAVAVIWIGGLAGASLVQGVAPSIVQAIYDRLVIFAGSAAGLCIVAAGITWFMQRR